MQQEVMPFEGCSRDESVKVISLMVGLNVVTYRDRVHLLPDD